MRKLCPGCGNLMGSTATTCRRCSLAAQTRGSNPNWKGGKSYHAQGYVLRQAPDHPRATKNGYVLEHILVMEETLGRYLLPPETVHHRNGVKGDNRPENLELWTRPQPNGIRVEDAVEWAKEILARYT